MKRVFLGLGSNVGNSQEIVLSALSQISLLKFVCDFQKSPLYRTTPVSDPLQESFMNENFINAVCSFETSEEDPFIVLRCLQQIEKDLGKKKKLRNQPRPIDIDILLFKDQVVSVPILEIPHPRMLERLFVLKPLSSLEETILYPRCNQPPLSLKLKVLLKDFNNQYNEVAQEIS